MYAHHFSLDPGILYFNHAAVAPWPVKTVDAVTRFARENGDVGARHYPDWLVVESELRKRLAELINAPSTADIALLKSTSEGLSVIAHGLPWQAGDNIVSIAQEFPSNRVVWQSLEPRGVEVRLLDLDNAVEPEASLMRLCDPNTRLLAVSSVQYASGYRLQLEKLGAFCRERKILFVIDAIQSLGAMPFDVTVNLADAVVADGHKWLLGPEGTALFYCHETLRERLHLHQYGWHMLENAMDFEQTHWHPATDARRFECGSPNMLGIHALHASLGLLLEVGMATTSDLIGRNCDTIIEETDQRGFELVTPRERSRRAGIVTFRIPSADNAQVQRQLMERGVICAYRGGGIRFSPHFYTTEQQIRRAFASLDQIVG
jgi:cysteine desulfurase / selenocysteine lyase